MNSLGKWAAIGLALGVLVSASSAGDWPRFRGPNGTGISADKAAVPVQWSSTANIRWKVDSPGRGVSSPIVVGTRVFVTGYTGYGASRDANERMEDLQRHLLCLDRATGKKLWQASIPAEMPEDQFGGMGVPAHGYASHTPTSDGERVYAFFGKTGVIAFDLDGKQLWKKNVGKESGRQRWGSAASPIVLGDLVIVNASDEASALIALDKVTGEEKWRAQADGMSNSWSTPVVASAATGDEIVVGVPFELWGFNPANGKLKWFSKGGEDETASSSAVTVDGVVYVQGGRGGNMLAVRTGGKGDAAKQVVWESRAAGRFPTPVIFEDHIYTVNRGVLSCHNVKTGDRVFQNRLASGETVTDEGGAGGGFGGGFGGGRRGGMGGDDYASPVIADGKLFLATKAGRFYVVAAKPKFELLATNDLTSDSSGFDGTPAISDGEIFVRSHAAIYCISAKK